MVSSIFIYNIPQLKPQHGFQVLEAKKLLIHNTIENDAISRHHKSLYNIAHTHNSGLNMGFISRNSPASYSKSSHHLSEMGAEANWVCCENYGHCHWHHQ